MKERGFLFERMPNFEPGSYGSVVGSYVERDGGELEEALIAIGSDSSMCLPRRSMAREGKGGGLEPLLHRLQVGGSEVLEWPPSSVT